MKLTVKILSLIIAIICAFGLIACNTGNTDKNDSETPKNAKLRSAIDLTKAWNEVSETENSLVQGCIIIRKEFAEAHPAEVKAFLDEYKASVDFVNANVEEASALIAEAGIVPKAAIAKKAIPNCNIAYMEGDAMKNSLSAFYETLYSVNPAAIGGALPDDGLYYKRAETASAADSTLKVNVTVLSGTTGMGAAKLISDAKAGNATLDYTFNVVADPTQISAGIVGKSIDIAAVPTNLASTLYKKTNGGVQVLAVNTLGVLYIMEKGNSLTDIKSLKGKTVYVPGQGTNPEYILQYIIEKNGMKVGTDVIFDYTYNSPDALANAVSAGLVDIALLPEPKVSVILIQQAAAEAANTTASK